MSTEHDLEQRLQEAAPAPGQPPDMAALWRRSRGVRWTRRVGGVAAVGLLAAGLAGAAGLRPAVEFAAGPAAGGPAADVADAERYCTEAEGFLGVVAKHAEPPTPADEAPTQDFDFRASHKTLTEDFARIAAVAPSELADAWDAVQTDLAAQGQVWESFDWDLEQAGGWPAVLQELSSLPTSAAGSEAMETLTADYTTRCD